MKRTIYISITLGLFIVIVVFVNIFISNRRNNNITPTTFSHLHTDSKSFLVEIKGEIKYPGIYKFSEEIYLFEVIDVAGGLLDDANKDDINMLMLINKDTSIYISKVETNSSYVIDKEIIDRATLININTASKEELLALPGIGEAKALSIISYRSSNGAFKTIEDIKNVSGIGDTIYEKIKELITV